MSAPILTSIEPRYFGKLNEEFTIRGKWFLSPGGTSSVQMSIGGWVASTHASWPSMTWDGTSSTTFYLASDNPGAGIHPVIWTLNGTSSNALNFEIVERPSVTNVTTTLIAGAASPSLSFYADKCGTSSCSNRSVAINGINCPILTWPSNDVKGIITVTVPSSVVASPGDKLLTVTNYAGTSDVAIVSVEAASTGGGGSTPTPTYEVPEITDVTPDPLVYNTSKNVNVTISGNNFGTSKGSIKLLQDDNSNAYPQISSSQIISWGDSSIIVSLSYTGVTLVEALKATRIEISKPYNSTVGTQKAAYPVSVDAPPKPTINYLNPDTKLNTEIKTIEIIGENFGTVKGTLKYGSATLSTATWTDTKITVSLGVAVSSADFVVIDKLNVQSEPASFTVTELTSPVITLLTPSTSDVDEYVNIIGTNFGTQGQVNLDGRAIPVSDYADTSISFKVPSWATTGMIEVVRAQDSKSSNKKPLTIAKTTTVKPAILTIDPTTGLVSTRVTIRGLNFLDFVAGTSKVLLGQVDMKVLAAEWSDTEIIAVIPADMEVAVNYFVVYNANGASNSVKFVVTAAEPPAPTEVVVVEKPKPIPSILRLDPALIGYAGRDLTIFGKDFGTELGTVYYNNDKLTVKPGAWTDSAIVCLIPSVAGRGIIYVENTAGTSNKVPFVVSPDLPAITNVTPNVVNVGDTVTVTGRNFGATFELGVTFLATGYQINKRINEVDSWSSTEIKFKVKDTYDFTKGQISVVNSVARSNWADINLVGTATNPNSISLTEIRNEQGQLIVASGNNISPITGIKPNSAIVRNLNAEKLNGMTWDEIVSFINSKIAVVQGITDRLSSISGVFPDSSGNIKLCGVNGVEIVPNPTTNEILIKAPGATGTTAGTSDSSVSESVNTSANNDFIYAIEVQPGLKASYDEINRTVTISVDPDYVSLVGHTHDNLQIIGTAGPAMYTE